MLEVLKERLFKRIPDHSRTLSEIFLYKFGANNSYERGSSMMSDSLFTDLKFSNQEKKMNRKIVQSNYRHLFLKKLKFKTKPLLTLFFHNQGVRTLEHREEGRYRFVCKVRNESVVTPQLRELPVSVYQDLQYQNTRYRAKTLVKI